VDKASVGDAWLLHPFLFPVLVILVGGGAFDKSKAKAFTSTQETRGDPGAVKRRHFNILRRSKSPRRSVGSSGSVD
jgi:hypothetical protein